MTIRSLRVFPSRIDIGRNIPGFFWFFSPPCSISRLYGTVWAGRTVRRTVLVLQAKQLSRRTVRRELGLELLLGLGHVGARVELVGEGDAVGRERLAQLQAHALAPEQGPKLSK